MNIDVKILLYKSKQMSEARRNALIAMDTLQERYNRYRADENRWIRGTSIVNIPEMELIHEEDTVGKVDYLKWVVRELNTIIDAISRAAATLNQEQRELIELRYFDDNTVTYVCGKMHIKENKYHYVHKIALSAMTACLNPLYITDEFLDALLFSPYKERWDTTDKSRKIKVFEELIGSPKAS